MQRSLIAGVLSTILTLLAEVLPFDVLSELPREASARARPTPFDLAVALGGGAAAAYALAQSQLSAALPWVAIATALMPPLCTVGIGLALRRPDVWAGALLLFLTNFVAITFAGIVVFAMLGFRPRQGNQHNGFFVSGFLDLLITIPLIFLRCVLWSRDIERAPFTMRSNQRREHLPMRNRSISIARKIVTFCNCA